MEFTKYKKIRQLGDEENIDIFKDGEDIIYIQETGYLPEWERNLTF